MTAGIYSRCTVEYLGTFLVVFAAAGTACASRAMNVPPGMDALALALAYALALVAAATVFGPVSGGHLNPAVSVGALVAGRLSLAELCAYVAAQMGGATAAGFVVKFAMPVNPYTVAHGGAAVASADLSGIGVFLVEAVATALVVLVTLAASTRSGGRLGLLPAGAALFACVLVTLPLTGGSLNPARAFGAALPSGTWILHWAYWAGPLVGGAAASVLWSFFLEDPDEA